MSNIPFKSRVKSDRIFIVWLFLFIIGVASAMAFNAPKPIIQQEPTDFRTDLNKEECQTDL